MKTLKERLSYLWQGESIVDIAKHIGMSEQGLFRVFKEDTLPKADTLLNIHKASGCDLKWLMTGEGSPFPNDAAGTPTTAMPDAACSLCDVLGNEVDSDDFVFVPRYDVKAAAGGGRFNEDIKPMFSMAFRRSWVADYLGIGHFDLKHLAVIGVSGDSMQGVINHGDNLLINLNINTPSDGLFVLRLGDMLFVKQTQLLPGHQLLVTSANPVYQPFTINLAEENQDFAIVAKVLWFGRTVNPA